MKLLQATTARRLITLLGVALAVAVAGCSKKEHGASQTAAKVNREEITVHQINFVLQQQRGLRPDQIDLASKQILERLIDQELALRKAEELKIDREPRVVQQLEAAKREIVARAYAERLGEGASKPTPEEAKQYYEDKPNLFKNRRIYSIQELQIEAKPEQTEVLRAKLNAAKNLSEFVEYLKANDFKFAGSQAVRGAEQLPLQSLVAFAKMKEGDSVLNSTPTGVQVIYIAGVRSQPIDLEHARPAIEQYLLNERKRELVSKDLKNLRASSKIEYLGKFADKAASAPAVAASASAVDIVPEPAAASGLDAGSINKGMGLK